MPRAVLEGVDVRDLRTVTFAKPVRLVFDSPGRGGPRICDVRSATRHLGRIRLSGTPIRTFVDVDPGECESPIVALETIARDDAEGLQRMILTALPHVDEIVIGVDARSDAETLKVALRYADDVRSFSWADIGVAEADWAPTEKNPRGKINFAAARNWNRQRVHAPWTLVVDSDEYIESTCDLRSLLRTAPAPQSCYQPLVRMKNPEINEVTFQGRDHHRLARTHYRWVAGVHNQLIVDNDVPPTDLDMVIVSDLSLRSKAERDRRDAQRSVSIEDLAEAADGGDLNALFHLAKHRAGEGPIAEAVRLAEDFRLRVEPNGPLAWQRQWIAVAVGFAWYHENNLQEANRWACRALLDGPAIPAFCLLGDVAEDEGDLQRARTWYECAWVATDRNEMAWPGLTEMRWGRLAALRAATASPEAETSARKAKESAGEGAAVAFPPPASP